MRVKTADFEVAGGGDGGSIVAYASTFDREPDSYGDVVAPGAFDDTLRAWRDSGKPIPLLFGHNMDDPDYNIGAVTSAEEDERGLRVEASFDPDNPKAQYVRKPVGEGRVSKMSFAYEALDEGPVELPDGTRAKKIRRTDPYEAVMCATLRDE